MFDKAVGLLTETLEYNHKTEAHETYRYQLVEEVIGVIERRFPRLSLDKSDAVQAIEQLKAIEVERQRPVEGIDGGLCEGVTLRPHQNEALRVLDENEVGALIGLDEGMGKTLVALAHAYKHKKRLMVVAPSGDVEKWCEEAEKFFPEYFRGKTQVMDDVEGKFDRGAQPDLGCLRLACTDYPSLKKFQPEIAQAGFDTLIIDESQHLGNWNGQIWARVRKMRDHFKHRILLSSNLIDQTKMQIKAQTDLIRPGFLLESKMRSASAAGVRNTLSQSKVILLRERRDMAGELDSVRPRDFEFGFSKVVKEVPSESPMPKMRDCSILEEALASNSEKLAPDS